MPTHSSWRAGLHPLLHQSTLCRIDKERKTAGWILVEADNVLFLISGRITGIIYITRRSDLRLLLRRTVSV